MIRTSKVYNEGKTTIPEDIRERRGIEDGDIIVWRVKEDKITIEKEER